MKPENIIIGVIIGILIGLFIGWADCQIEQKKIVMQEKMMKLQICYDYNSKEGDYYWRHENCKGLEKEILELKEFKF